MKATMEPVQQSIATTRFGEVSFTETDVLTFPWGLPGFNNLHRFLALSLEEQPNFVWLQSLEDGTLALPASDPWGIFPNYDPRLPAYATEALGLRDAGDFTILCIVVVGKGAEQMTMNLMAPVIVNLKTRQARQVMLENSGYSVREAIPRKAAADTEVQPA